MDNLTLLRTWYYEIGPTQAKSFGSIKSNEREDNLFTAVYLLLESGLIDYSHLSLTALSDRLLKKERTSSLVIVQLLILAQKGMGHLYVKPGESEGEVAIAIQSVIDSRKGLQSEQVLIEQLQSMCSIDQLTLFFKNALQEVVNQLGTIDPIIVTAGKEGALFCYDESFGFYTGALYAVETELSSWFQKRLSSSDLIIDTQLELICNEVFVDNPMMLGTQPMAFHVRQKAAVIMAAQKQLSVISGGPGTGKTSTVVALLRVLLRVNPEVAASEIAMVAPTGRAAARMVESVAASVSLIKDKSEGSRDAVLDAIEGKTIHRLLKYNPSRNGFSYSKDSHLPIKILIIDEVSMVDAELFLHLTQALNDDAIVILLGDHNQLPSVQAGAVLSDLFGKALPSSSMGIPSLSEVSVTAMHSFLSEDIDAREIQALTLNEEHLLKNSMVVLSKSHRSEKSILNVSTAINEQSDSLALSSMAQFSTIPEWPLIQEQDDGSCRCTQFGSALISIDNTNEQTSLHELLYSWFNFHYGSHTFTQTSGSVIVRSLSYRELINTITQTFGDIEITASEIMNSIGDDSTISALFNELFEYMNQSQVLAVTRNGPTGTREINRQVSEHMQEQLGSLLEGEVYPGLPIIITQNDYNLGVFNGDCGVVIRCGGRLFVAIPGVDSVGVYPIRQIVHFEPAYAITVHKSQGSEYEYSLLVLPKEMNRVMTKEVLYTAVTRSKYFSGVVSSVAGFASCINQSISRRSGISQRIS